ncbi:MAG: glycosyltransferase involved in cell wall biosynthesis, partial [Psychroserpens sp.]
TIESVINQTEENINIIVIDDGSTDETPSKLIEYKESINNIRIVNSGGPSRPRNVGIENSTTPFISFFDADDIMHPDKLERSIEYLNSFPSVGLLCTDFNLINPKGNSVRKKFLTDYVDFRRYFISTEIKDLYLIPADKAYHQLLRANFVGTSSVVCPRKVFSDVGSFDESMKNADDIDMWRRITKAGYDVLFYDKTMHDYRVGLDSISTRGITRFPAMIKGLEKQIETLSNLEDIKCVSMRLSDLYLSYGWGLRNNKQYSEAIKAYRQSYIYKRNFKALIGLAITWLRSLIIQKNQT